MQTSGYFPVFFWRSVDNIIMVLTKTQKILILKQSLLPDCSIRVSDCSIRVYIDLFLSKAFSHVGFSIDQ